DRPDHPVPLLDEVPRDRQRDDDVTDAGRLDESDLHVAKPSPRQAFTSPSLHVTKRVLRTKETPLMRAAWQAPSSRAKARARVQPLVCPAARFCAMLSH